jgi:hypothetical protein
VDAPPFGRHVVARERLGPPLGAVAGHAFELSVSRSIKRVAAAVGEGSTVVSLVHEYLDGLDGAGATR